MSQDINTQEQANQSSSTSTAIQPWSAEADADKLMDDLFADIDRILEGSSKLPTEPAKPDYVSLKSLVIPSITAPPAVIPTQDLVEQPSEQNKESSETESSETKGKKSSNSHPQKSGWSVDKFLLVMALISVGLTALLLLITQKQRFAPWLLNFTGSPSPETQLPSEADYKFGEYGVKALEAIDQEAKEQQQVAMAGGGTGNPNLPPGGGNGNPNLPPGGTNSSGAINFPTGANPPGTVLERIYYPVYPPQSSWIPPVPPANSSVAPPSTSAPSPTANPPTPKPPQVTAQTPPAPAPTAAPTSPTVSVSPPPPAPPPPPPVNHTLVGVLESDQLSAALFEIDGITQRINIGEAIGTSGWMLVEVNNGEAIIRRNGEVRSVYTGQTF